MLEVLYDEATKEVRGWCGDPNEFGNFKPKAGQAVVVLPIDIPPMSDTYTVDLVGQKVVVNPAYVAPVVRDLTGEIDEIKTRLAKLERK